MFHVEHSLPSVRQRPGRSLGYIARVTLDAEFQEELDGLAAAQRLRTTYGYAGDDRTRPSVAGGTQLTSFATNDYLGLAGHPALRTAAQRAIETTGVGAGASRLVTGESPIHRNLELALASYLGTAEALLFPTGYQTNVGVLTALVGPDDLVVSDAANHASIIDGCRLSRARVIVYPHLEAPAAAAALAQPASFRRRLLVTESIFSMDGDRAPLEELAAACRANRAIFMVDEAHALGVAGPSGRGLAASNAIQPDVLVATLGKALGAHGGFACGSAALRSLLINRARPFIYSTAGPASTAAAAQAGLELVRSPSGDHLRARATTLAAHARLGLRSAGVDVPGQDLILPVIVGEEREALLLAERLFARGLLVPAIRPPTVAPGTSRLRVTISAAHTAEDVDRLVDAIAAHLTPNLRGPALAPARR